MSFALSVDVDSGKERVLRMPLKKGATVGMNASCTRGFGGFVLVGAGRSLERCHPASRSWMWSVSEYGRIPPPRLSGVTLGKVSGRVPTSPGWVTVPAPLYPETPKTVGQAGGARYGRRGAMRSCVEVA